MPQFTDRMEREADEIASLMERTSRHGWRARIGDRSNVKPWYSSRSAFVPGVDVVLIGVNPTGDPDDPPADTQIDLYMRNLNSEQYNAYLDECWKGKPKGEETLQKGVRKVFSELHGGPQAGDSALRDSVCFNVCPLRTNDASLIPPEVWSKSVNWCLKILKHLKPNLIICNGISDPSPLAVFGRSLILLDKEPLGTTYVRYGVIASGDLDGTKVLGIPHLSRVGPWRATPLAIARIATDHDLP